MLRYLSPSMLLALLAATLLAGCDRGERAADVVLYTSVDEPVSRQIIDAFEQETGYRVRLVADTEATRSVGLAERLRAERNGPQADVWWGNEPFHTVAIADEGLLQPYESPSAADVPEQFRDAQDRWTGNGLRARVFIVNSQAWYVEGGPAIRSPAMPEGLGDLLDPSMKGKVVMARPTAGTTGSHVAALYVLWGEQRADSFFRALHDNGVQLVGGNSQSAQQVAAGNYGVGLTDNDDVANALGAAGAPGAASSVHMILPDQGEGEIGTLTIPTTVGLVAGRPDNAAARQLVDFLLSPDTEKLLLKAGFVGYSVRASSAEHALKPMSVEYAEVARRLPEAVGRATALLEGRTPPP